MRRLSDPSRKDGPALVLLADALAAPVAMPTPVAPNPADERRLEHQAVLEKARREGLAQGLADAEAELAKRVEAVALKLREAQRLDAQRLETRVAALDESISGLASALAQHARHAEEVAVEAAFAALVRVLGQKSADRALMRELCEEALKSRGIGAATLRLSPADHPDVDLGDTHLSVVADSSLSPGQCVLESPRGASDTGLDVRLEAIKRAFLDGLAAHGPGPKP